MTLPLNHSKDLVRFAVAQLVDEVEHLSKRFPNASPALVRDAAFARLAKRINRHE